MVRESGFTFTRLVLNASKERRITASDVADAFCVRVRHLAQQGTLAPLDARTPELAPEPRPTRAAPEPSVIGPGMGPDDWDRPI